MISTTTGFRSNGRSMVGDLRQVLVCSPRSAGWGKCGAGAPARDGWRDLGFLHSPDFEKAQSQHEALCHELRAASVEVVDLPSSPELSLDAVYTHDPSLATDYGIILMHPGKPNRIAEARQHGEFFRSLGIPMLGTIKPPGTTEAGDIVWLDPKTLLIGNGYRTNADGIANRRVRLKRPINAPRRRIQRIDVANIGAYKDTPADNRRLTSGRNPIGIAKRPLKLQA